MKTPHAPNAPDRGGNLGVFSLDYSVYGSLLLMFQTISADSISLAGFSVKLEFW